MGLSLCRSTGPLVTAASFVRAFNSWYLKQETPHVTVGHLMEQRNIVKKPKKFGRIIAFSRPTDKPAYTLLVVVFGDEIRSLEYRKISVIAGFLIED